MPGLEIRSALFAACRSSGRQMMPKPENRSVGIGHGGRARALWLCTSVALLLAACNRDSPKQLPTANSSPIASALTGGNAPQTPPGSAEPAAASHVVFTDMAQRAGIEFTYHNGEDAGHFSILESLGGGVALLDYDLDGRLDVFLPGGGKFGPNGAIVGL